MNETRDAVSDGPRRRRMIRGTIARIGELAMRYGRPSQLATLDCTSSRRSTVMCALLRATAVTTEYQRDSSSKRPRSSVVSAARAPTRRPMSDGGHGVSSSRRRLPSPSSHRTGLVGLTSGSSGRRGQRNSIAYSDASITAHSYSSAKVSCAGATTRCRSRYRCSKERSPCSAKYRLSRAWSTGPQWLSAHKDLWPS